MIISENRRYVFISSIKCGTNTMYDFLRRHAEGVRIDGDFHRQECEEYIDRGFYIFTCVRDPYDRALSLWTSMVRRATQDGHDRYGLHKACPQGMHRFEPFAEWLVSEWRHQPQRALQPLVVHHMGTHVPNHIHLENITQELSELPIMGQEEAIMLRSGGTRIETLNTSDKYRPQDGVSEEAARILKPWASLDCDAYGYPVR